MKISIKDLLLIVAFCAGIAWCAAQVGFENGDFWFVTIVSGLMSAVVISAAKGGKLRSRAIVFPVVVLVPQILLAMGLIFPALFINTVLLIIVAIVFAVRCPAKRRTVAITVGILNLVSFGFGAYLGLSEARKLEATRKRFP